MSPFDCQRAELELTPTGNEELRTAWERIAAQVVGPAAEGSGRGVELGPRQWLVLITCRDERQQVELLGRFIGEGLECRAMQS